MAVVPCRDPITTHVLNTMTGSPAANLQVGLTLVEPRLPGPEETVFVGTTDNDGRVACWNPQSKSQSYTMKKVFDEVQSASTAAAGGEAGGGRLRLLWHLRYETERYFGEGKTLFKVVELQVYQDVVPDMHLHVPLLLGPWSYTTYRGS